MTLFKQNICCFKLYCEAVCSLCCHGKMFSLSATVNPQADSFIFYAIQEAQILDRNRKSN